MFSHFDHSQFRRYIISFGTLFSRIELTRKTSTTEVQRIRVPLEYGPKERWFKRLMDEPSFAQGISQVLPRLAFEVTSVSYDGTRKINTLNTLNFPSTSAGRLARTYVGVPYNLNIQLTAVTKLQSDAFQIVEQILPYFTPDLVYTLSPVPEVGIVDQVPLTLVGINGQDNYTGDFEHRRAITWNLDFLMKVYFYGPRRQQSRIEEVLVDLYNVPFTWSLDAPEYLVTEDNKLILTEDETGHLLSEATPNTYTHMGRVARIEVDAVPPEQDPSGNVHTVTTITEYDGDTIRNLKFEDDEPL